MQQNMIIQGKAAFRKKTTLIMIQPYHIRKQLRSSHWFISIIYV